MKISISFNPQDLWVGVYWEREEVSAFMRGARLNQFSTDAPPPSICYRFYVCIVPCFPIRISFQGSPRTRATGPMPPPVHKVLQSEQVARRNIERHFTKKQSDPMSEEQLSDGLREERERRIDLGREAALARRVGIPPAYLKQPPPVGKRLGRAVHLPRRNIERHFSSEHVMEFPERTIGVPGHCHIDCTSPLTPHLDFCPLKPRRASPWGCK